MDFQLLLNMSDRGWLETTYYQLGSDYRGNLTYLLSYMSQMGGWSILDHAPALRRRIRPTTCASATPRR